MIISEKQIMQLIQIANECMTLALEKERDHWLKLAGVIATLIDTINNQQSEELKDIK